MVNFWGEVKVGVEGGKYGFFIIFLKLSEYKLR